MPTLYLSPPNPKQEEFLKAQQRFIAYGGARGGGQGKSWAVRKKAELLALGYDGIVILILRRTFSELRGNHILPMQKDLSSIASYKETEKTFYFPNGSRILFGYCDSERDILRYQGQEYDVIFLDEATQFTEFQFMTLTACLRGANPFPKRFYLTCNPGGVGHAWVKRLFIDRDFTPTENPKDYLFIPAKVWDNPVLLKQNPEYIQQLSNLPPDLKRAWLDGDWNALAGQYFPEFRQEIHVIKPFLIPSHWRRYVSFDYGLDMLACYWIAVDEKGFAYVYQEYYQSGLIISQAAKAIQERTQEPVFEYLAPPDLWNRRQDTGKSGAELFSEQGIWLKKAQNNRVAGWYELKEWLATELLDGKPTPRLRIFENCPHLIRTLPLIQRDEKNPNDCATEPHELTHAPDALRYFVAGRPLPAQERQQEKKRLPFPFEEKENEEYLPW